MESIGDYTSGNSLAGMEQPLYGIRAARAQIDQRAALSKRPKRLDPLWIYPPLERQMCLRRPVTS